MKRTITRFFATIKAAESFQRRLYAKNDHVKLTRSPMFTEHGMYTWEIA